MIPAAMGNWEKLRVAVLRLNNSAAETTYTLTAALAGMTLIACVIAADEGAAAATRESPTVDSSTGFYTQIALTFTAGDELTFLVIGI